MRLWLGVGAMLGLSVAATAWTAPAPAPPEPEPEPGRRPERLVSATLSTDEMLLGMLEPSDVFAVTRFALDPEVSNVAERARRVRHVVTGEAEQLVALEPDVVLADPVGNPETRALLRRVGVPVLRVPPCTTLDDVRRNVRWVGEWIGEPDRAEALVAEMDRTVAEATARVDGAPRPRVLLYNRGGFTAGAETLFDELLRLAGGRNVAAEAGLRGHASLPVERALALDPEVILTTDYRAGGRARTVVERPALAEDPVWRDARAVRSGRVFALDGRSVLSTSHHVARAVPEIARLLHPERFR